MSHPQGSSPGRSPESGRNTGSVYEAGRVSRLLHLNVHKTCGCPRADADSLLETVPTVSARQAVPREPRRDGDRVALAVRSSLLGREDVGQSRAPGAAGTEPDPPPPPCSCFLPLSCPPLLPLPVPFPVARSSSPLPSLLPHVRGGRADLRWLAERSPWLPPAPGHSG